MEVRLVGSRFNVIEFVFMYVHILNWELIGWVRDTSVRTDIGSVSRPFLRIFIELGPCGARL